jgi:hypothetical protein
VTQTLVCVTGLSISAAYFNSARTPTRIK